MQSTRAERFCFEAMAFAGRRHHGCLPPGREHHKDSCPITSKRWNWRRRRGQFDDCPQTSLWHPRCTKTILEEASQDSLRGRPECCSSWRSSLRASQLIRRHFRNHGCSRWWFAMVWWWFFATGDEEHAREAALWEMTVMASPGAAVWSLNATTGSQSLAPTLQRSSGLFLWLCLGKNIEMH